MKQIISDSIISIFVILVLLYIGYKNTTIAICGLFVISIIALIHIDHHINRYTDTSYFYNNYITDISLWNDIENENKQPLTHILH